MQKILCVFAHPDDETFGLGGALAVWAKQGVEIHILCLTCGGAGGSENERPKELRLATKILGIENVECAHYPDGELCNKDLDKLEADIIAHIEKIQPDTLLTFHLNGVSGHIDHMVVASATTQAFRKSKIAQKLMYFAVPKYISQEYGDYFVYFPPGCEREEVDEVVDFAPVWPTLKQAMYAHNSQLHDGNKIIQLIENNPQEDWFIVKKLGEI